MATEERLERALSTIDVLKSMLAARDLELKTLAENAAAWAKAYRDLEKYGTKFAADGYTATR